MTTTILDIVSDALRESMLTALGAEPEAAAASEALRLLNRIVASVFGNEVGEALKDWPLSSAYPYDGWNATAWEFLESDIRIIAIDQSAQSLNLPPHPKDGDRIQIVDAGAGLATYPITLVRQASLFDGEADDYVANTDGLNMTWLYRADLADWKRVLPLALTDEFPFPEAHDDAFIGLLAMRLSPRYQQGLSGESAAALKRSTGQLKSAYSRTKRVSVDPALQRLSGQTFGSGGGPASTRAFLNGDDNGYLG